MATPIKPRAIADETSNHRYVLLDDWQATEQSRRSRLYTDFSHEYVCIDATCLEDVYGLVDQDLRKGLHAVLITDYEWGCHLIFDRAHPAVQKSLSNQAALRFLLFRHLTHLSCDEVDKWLVQQDASSPAGILNVDTSVSHAEFEAAIARIHQAIETGDAYQVNYTYRLDFSAFGPPVALYRRLRARQPVRYGALIALADDTWILSCSPELFIEHQAGRIVARPMKGTTARLEDAQADAQAAQDLAGCAKNRAENLMIVDLLRNDLGQVAQTGSVCARDLFKVEPYATVWQMTSTVQATLDPQISMAALLRALFPCGSITGAPKYAAMQLIDKLEKAPRGIYTGAIGWLDAPTHALGAFCLSVAIRTLMLGRRDSTGLRAGHMGVGAGIVLDSQAQDEYQECQLKARFLTGMDPGFALLETCYATFENGIRHLERHLQRLARSARYCGFRFDEFALRAMLSHQCRALSPGTPYRIRLALRQDGKVELSVHPLSPLQETSVRILLASDYGFAPVQARDWLLQHKTTWRATQDAAWQQAAGQGAFDMAFFNQHDELTEGGRSNIFVKLEGRWYTPPLSCGVLPGVMRSVLLDDAALRAQERIIKRVELRHAEAVLVCNALRGALAATLAGSSAD